EWGGETEFVDVSAKTGQNLETLIETILLLADLQDLKADPTAPARGVAVEAHLDKGRGPIATLLVQRGTLRVGDALVCGTAWCRAKAMFDENMEPVREAGPSKPVEVLRWTRCACRCCTAAWAASTRTTSRWRRRRARSSSGSTCVPIPTHARWPRKRAWTSGCTASSIRPSTTCAQRSPGCSRRRSTRWSWGAPRCGSSSARREVSSPAAGSRREPSRATRWRGWSRRRGSDSGALGG